jgi:polyketide cyclase/dehydrase/lipid transport protein
VEARWHIRIARSPEDVFDFLADLRNEPQFNPDASNVQQVTPGPIGLGTSYTEDFRRIGAYTTTIDRYERPRELRFDARNPKVDAQVTFTLAPAGDGETDVGCVVELTMKGAMRFMEPMLRGRIQREIETSRGPLLKQALERTAAT